MECFFVFFLVRSVSEMLVIVCSILLILVVPTNSYQQCFAKPLQKNPEAEARFSVIISLRQPDGEEECKDITTSGIMAVAAVDWAVSRLNNASLVPGVKFGYDLYDDCGVDRYSVYSALDAMDYYFPQGLRSCSGNTSKYYLGILGPSRSHTAQQVLNIIENTDIPVVSPFATFPDLRNSKNFFRTVPSDDDQVSVFVELMEKQRWNYVVAMHTLDNYGTNGITKIVDLAKQRNICVNVISGFKDTETFDDTTFKDSIFDKLLKHLENTTDDTLGVLYFGHRNVIQKLLSKMQLTVGIKPKLRNIKWIMSDSVGTRESALSSAPDVTNDAMTVSMTSSDIPDVLHHVNKIQSSAPTDDISMLIKNYGQISGDDWKDYIASVLDGVFTITMSLKTAFDIRCTGYKVICEGFDAYYNSKKLETMLDTKVNYSALGVDIAPAEFVISNRVIGFNSSGDLVPDLNTALYNVNMYKNTVLTQVGEYVNGAFRSYQSFPNAFATSTCQKGCEQCVYTQDILYEFIPGDIYIIGFFSLHRTADDPFTCGEFRNLTFDVLSVEAFLNSIQESQTETHVRFGGIAFDDCYSSSRATMIISDLYTGKLKIPSEANPIDPSKIIGVVGPFPSGVTVPVTFLFSSLALPSISYASTSPDLDDKDINFPYFFRTVPSDVDQAQAMVDVLKTMGWRTVGLVYVDNNYGSKGKNAFKTLSNSSGICIVAEIVVKQEDTVQTNYEVYKGLDDVRKSGTNLFVYFGTEGRMADVLSYIKEKRQWNNENPYIFIGSDDWADSRNIRDNYGDMVEGSLSFKIKTRSTNTHFIENLIHKTSSVTTASYWYKLFFRNHFKCYFDEDFVKPFPARCTDNITITDTSGIMADGRVSHCIMAVKALTKGIAKAMADYCDGVNELPCPTYLRNIDVVRDDIAKVSLLDDNQISFHVFDKNRNGDTGFQILQIQREDNGYVYSEVGSYDNNNLVLKSTNVNDGIGNKLSVLECDSTNPGSSTDPLGTSVEPEDFRTAEIVIISLLGALCVVLVIVIVAVVFCFWRKMKGLHKMLDDTKARITYYNEIGTARREKQKHSEKKNGGIGFDSPIFPNGGPAAVEPPGQHYLPLHESDPTRTNHKYEGNALDLLNQTTPKQFSSSQQIQEAIGSRPDLPPRNMPEKRGAKSESDIHNSFPIIKPKFATTSQPRMGIALASTSTDSLHSQGSAGVFYQPRAHLGSSQNEPTYPTVNSQNHNHRSPSNSVPSSPRLPYEKPLTSPSSPSEKRTQSQSSPLSHKSSIHSQFSGDTLHMIGNPSPQRRKRLKSFSSEEPQKISRV